MTGNKRAFGIFLVSVLAMMFIEAILPFSSNFMKAPGKLFMPVPSLVFSMINLL